MNKRFCDCCLTELDSSQPKFIYDEKGQLKTTRIKRYDQNKDEMVEYDAPEMEYNPKTPIMIQLNLNNYDMIMREFCKECYKKIQKEAEGFWNILYGINRV